MLCQNVPKDVNAAVATIKTQRTIHVGLNNAASTIQSSARGWKKARSPKPLGERLRRERFVLAATAPFQGMMPKDDLKDLDELLDLCFLDGGDSNVDSKLNVKVVVGVREQLAEACFSKKPEVALKALRYLQRVVANSPLGDPHVACGLLPLARSFASKLTVEEFEGMPLSLGMSMIQCVFVILEAVQAEYLIGNLPAISQKTRDMLWDFCENLRKLSTRGANADVLGALWLETLLELVKRMKTPVTQLEEIGIAAGSAIGAAIKLYRGDVVAGLSQLKGTFSRSKLLGEWFDDLLVLRKLVTDAVRSDIVFRQLKFTIQSGKLVSSTIFDGELDGQEKPFFLMHVVLSLRRLIQHGRSSVIRQGSFQLLIDYVVRESFYLQITAAQVLEDLCAAKNPEVRSTAMTVLAIAEPVILRNSRSSVLKDYATRLCQRQRGEEEKQHAQKFSGYLTVIVYFFEKLNEGRAAQGSSLLSIASCLSSHHAGTVMEALERMLPDGDAVMKLSTDIDPETQLSPIHQASMSGVADNLQWMLNLAREGKDREQLAGQRLPGSGIQPIHYAGSIEVMDLLLSARADLAARDSRQNTVLHLLKNAVVLDYVLAEKVPNMGSVRRTIAGFSTATANGDGYPPLFVPRGYDVTMMLLKHRADLHEIVKGENALHVAARADNAGTCQALIAEGIDVTCTNDLGATALFVAGVKALPGLLGTRLRSCVNQPNKIRRTPIFDCVRPEVAQQLCEAEADVNVRDRYDIAPIALHALRGGARKSEIMQCLLERKADPGEKDQFGDSIFLNAIYNNDIVQILLLTLGAEGQKLEDLFGQISGTGSSVAEVTCGCSSGAESLYALYIRGYDFTKENPETGSLAIGDNDIQRKFLQQRGVAEHATSMANERTRQTVLHEADFTDFNKVSTLLKQNADAASVNAFGESVLLCAVRAGGPHRVIRLLLEQRAVPTPGHSLVYAWAGAGQPGDGVLDLLLSARCSVNDRDEHECIPPLFAAILVWQRENANTTLDELIRRKANASLCDAFGRTPLLFAVHTGDLELVQKILALSRDSVFASDPRSGMTPGVFAEQMGFTDIKDLLQTSRKAKATSREALGKGKKDPFLLARLGLCKEVCKLISHYGEAEWKGFCPLSGFTILQAAMQGGNLELVKIILDRAPYLSELKSFAKSKHEMQTPLELLAEQGPPPDAAYEIADLLVKCRAYPFLLSGTFKLPLTIIATQASNFPVLKFLLEQRVSIEHRLLPAIEQVRDPRCVKLLFQYRASLHSEEQIQINKRLCGLLGVCSAGALRELLGHESCSPEVVNARGGLSETPICRARSRQQVELLLEYRADATAINNHGKTTLMYCPGKDVREAEPMARLLLESRCDAQHKDNSGKNVLAFLGTAPIARLLLEARADINHVDNTGSPVCLPCARQVKNLQAGFDYGMKLHVKDPHTLDDLTLYAAESKTPESLKLLLQKRADIFASKNKKQTTLLHKAVQGSLAVEDFVLNELCKKSPSRACDLLRAQDETGRSVVHLAVSNRYRNFRELHDLDEATRSFLTFDKDQKPAWSLRLLLRTCLRIDQNIAEEIVNIQDRDMACTPHSQTQPPALGIQ
eukprot:symbB.v1.2.034097.t1/scaffold4342.1/size40914/3